VAVTAQLGLLFAALSFASPDMLSFIVEQGTLANRVLIQIAPTGCIAICLVLRDIACDVSINPAYRNAAH
jgi:hypothetical protein